MSPLLSLVLIFSLIISAEANAHGPPCSVTIKRTETFKGHCVKLSQRGLVRIGCQAEGYLDPQNDDCAAAAEEIFG
ncbi:hypothetical protein FO519_002467 [Halicephalobus sp. NKZ332]|nr:hypothetical protein FO519_002467 [Halicephalobus sp. NKZ332]